MYRAYGGWTFAFDDYTALNVTTYLDDDNMTLMANIIDPYGMYVCVCMHMVCMYVCACIWYVCVCVCMHMVCMCVCACIWYVCMCVHAYV